MSNELNTIVLSNPKIQEVARVLPQIAGIRGSKECMKLAEDSELFELLSRKIDKAFKTAKPEGYEELEKELQDRMREKATWLESQEVLLPESEIKKQVLLTWEKGKAWVELDSQYKKKRDEILETQQTILIRARLTADNLPEKLNSIMVARTLRYFMDGYMPLNYEEEEKPVGKPEKGKK